MQNKNVLRGLGIAGSVLLMVGCFLPIVSLSMFGVSEHVILLQNGGDGLIIFPLSIIAIGLSAFAKFRWNLIPGLLNLAVVAINFFDIHAEFNNSEFGSLFTMNYFTWIVLFVGAGMVIASGVMGFLSRRVEAKSLQPATA